MYNAPEGMDDDMFEDAAELVGILGKMMKRGLSGNVSSGSRSTGTPASTPKTSKVDRFEDGVPGLPTPGLGGT